MKKLINIISDLVCKSSYQFYSKELGLKKVKNILNRKDIKK